MRIGIVNDSTLAVEALRRAVATQREHQIAWIAFNGEDAVVLCAKDTPDLIFMDLIMPGMDGVETTRRIMAATPCAILIVTGNVGANASRVFDAMGWGALDAVDTPTFESMESGRVAPLMAKVAIIGRLIGEKRADQALRRRTSNHAPARQLVAIGASAGGPAALSAVLAALPAHFPAAVVVIQHVDPQFAPGLADWLNQHSTLPVRLAMEGDQPLAGTVLLASTGDHLQLKDTQLVGYTPIPRDYPYRPSINVFFESITYHWPGKAVGVLLTGMGRDGALGLKSLRDKGCHTIAQDQATSAVYGMPKAAAALDAATEVLPLDRIAPRLIELIGTGFQDVHQGIGA
ncbi:chemotaxis response regulator protein-glutamate methylesterase [Dyella choica]|uniref:Protein-glutamate methylesterase/protein-glutamine glutaminase n=1 Tax=Dyella choica TaxID=1927959 RepID=A0A3S0PJP4_9GAMM|nr:chemotaxis response regulator protein-glutamate methylesterase [Dyella choica]RUL77565.1 chemotaxis response regulator protein-glutamate methylesterase [Dyella choica]